MTLPKNKLKTNPNINHKNYHVVNYSTNALILPFVLNKTYNVIKADTQYVTHIHIDLITISMDFMLLFGMYIIK